MTGHDRMRSRTISTSISRRALLGTAAGLAGTLAAPALLKAQEALPLKVGTVKFGAVNWVLETIRAEGLDRKNGLTIETVELANNQAGPISLLSGGSQVIVSDWPWAMHQRALGEPLKFAPYSSSLGGIMVAANAPAQKLTDLAGKRIGVAGSAIDKSWLLLQAYARKKLDFDIASKATIQFGAAPILSEQLRDGSLDAALNFWTQNERLKAVGLRELISMRQVFAELGIDPVPAFIGFIWKVSTEAARQPELISFLTAVREANAVLATSDTAWERLRPLLKATNEIEAKGLRASYVAGIASRWTPRDMSAAMHAMQLLIEAGDTELAKSGAKFDPHLFHVDRT